MQTISNIIGSFVFDSNSIIEESLFSDEEVLPNHKLIIEKKPVAKEIELQKKHDAKPADAALAKKFLDLVKAKHKERFYLCNLWISKEQIKNAVKEDNLISQAINDIDEIEKSANLLSKRLREWYELYDPETSRHIESHEEFIDAILSNSKEDLQKKFDTRFTMGAPLLEEHVKPMRDLAVKIKELYVLREMQKKYVETVMEKYFPNLNALAGPQIGAKLIAQAGGILRLSEFPASTLQLLGAEKALFRHMKTGSKPPKYGLIINHPLITAARNDEKGKAARALANKLSILAKVDYFKGEFVGDKIKAELEKKLNLSTGNKQQ